MCGVNGGDDNVMVPFSIACSPLMCFTPVRFGGVTDKHCLCEYTNAVFFIKQDTMSLVCSSTEVEISSVNSGVHDCALYEKAEHVGYRMKRKYVYKFVMDIHEVR